MLEDKVAMIAPSAWIVDKDNVCIEAMEGAIAPRALQGTVPRPTIESAEST
jgi:hypothetical protein